MGEVFLAPLLRVVVVVGWTFFIFCACAREPSSKLQASDQTGSFRLLTYNVAGLPQIVSRVRPAQNIPLISPLLNRYDLALVQEDFFYQHELRAAVKHPFRSRPLVIDHVRGLGDGLNQFSTMPFQDFERITWARCHGDLGAGSDCLTDKGFTRATHELADGIQVDVYNLHMDAGGSRADEAARAAQAQQLWQTIERESGGRAVIAAGDTNLRPSSNPILSDLMKRAGLRDACAVLNCKERERIDRVLYRSSPRVELSALDFDIAGEFVDAAGQPLSDHEAVAVEFSWTRRLLPRRN